MTNPFMAIHNAYTEALDRAVLWAWDRHGLSLRVIWRVVAWSSVGLYAAYQLTTTTDIRGEITAICLIALAAPLLDWLHFGRRSLQSPSIRNLAKLAVRSNPFMVFIKQAIIVWMALASIVALVIHGWLGLLLLGHDITWILMLLLLDAVVPTKPPRRKKKLALPKLKLPVITLPGLLPEGAKAR